MILVEYDKNNLTETRVQYNLVESGARGATGPPGTTVHNDTTGIDGTGTFHISENEADALTNAKTALTGTNPVASLADTYMHESIVTKFSIGSSVAVTAIPGRLTEVKDTSGDLVVTAVVSLNNAFKPLDSFGIFVHESYPKNKKVRVPITLLGPYVYLSAGEGMILQDTVDFKEFIVLSLVRSGSIKNVDLTGAQTLAGEMTGDYSTIDTSPFTIDAASLAAFDQDGQWAGFKNISGGDISVLGTYSGKGTILPDNATMLVSRRLAQAYNFDIAGGLV